MPWGNVMTMTPEFESLARAVYATLHRGNTLNWEQIKELSQDRKFIVARQQYNDCITVAKAALAELRHPSPRLIECRIAAMADDLEPTEAEVETIWTGMIDDILEDSK